MTLEIEHFVDTVRSEHWDKDSLNVYIFKNVFSDQTYAQLERAVLQLLNQHKKVTFATHRTSFKFEGQSKRIVSHKQNNRDQEVVYDMTFEKDWWYQTNDTIKVWSDEYLKNNINPVFYKYLKFFEDQPPFNEEPGCWIPFRWHMNVLEHSQFLLMHTDMNDQYLNTFSTAEARGRTLTFYMQDHIEGYGGEFCTDTGFVYKPKKNSVLSINGNSCLHGVNANMDPSGKPRLAFSTRWCHKDDLYLPGHPDKALYKLEF